MATASQVLASVGALEDGFDTLNAERGFNAAQTELLAGHRQALGNAARHFDEANPEGAAGQPRFAGIVSAAATARIHADALKPDDAAIDSFAGEVRMVTESLEKKSSGWRNAFQGALRIGADPARAAPTIDTSIFQSVDKGDDNPPPEKPEPYYKTLVKLFPVEAVTLYPLALGIADQDINVRYGLIGAIVLFVIALRFLATQGAAEEDAQLGAIGVAVISFLLYVAALGGFGVLFGSPAQSSQLVSFVTVMWVALVPYLVRKAPPPAK